jgi:hypothetical protein
MREEETYTLKQEVALEVDHELPCQVALSPLHILLLLGSKPAPLPLAELSPAPNNDGRMVVLSKRGDVGSGDGGPKVFVDDL